MIFWQNKVMMTMMMTTLKQRKIIVTHCLATHNQCSRIVLASPVIANVINDSQ